MRAVGILFVLGSLAVFVITATITLMGILSMGTAATGIDKECLDQAQKVLDAEPEAAANLTDARTHVGDTRGGRANQRAIARFDSCEAGRNAGAGMAVVLGFGFTVVVGILGLIGLTFGWVMARTRRVRACGSCGYFFEIY